jgi:hypothetical protein
VYAWLDSPRFHFQQHRSKKVAVTTPRKASVHGYSGWLVPFAVFIVAAALSGALLLYYLGPRPPSFVEERATPTASATRVLLSIGGSNFSIPGNYIRYRGARKGGALEQVALFALLPDFSGYTDASAGRFLTNAADSPVVEILIHDEPLKLSEMQRLQRIYLGYVTDVHGKAAPFGLTAYEFRNDSGYRGEDLFVGRFGPRLVVMRCDRLSARDISPSCAREMRLSHHAGLSYRFKRAQLARWREIASGVDSLMHAFMRS